MEDPRNRSADDSSVLDELPPAFAISETRMNSLLARNVRTNNKNANDDDDDDDDDNDEENEDEQKTLLQNLISNLRESQDDEFELEHAEHGYMSDEEEEEEEFPELEADPLQYASVRSVALEEEKVPVYDDHGYWNTSCVEIDTEELLKSL